MVLSAGARLGPYEILAPLGAGGMGEVYRARDTTLDRDVAIKVLPRGVRAATPIGWRASSAKPQTLAALNHPNIAQIYGLEDSGRRVRALVMELVGRRGPLAALIARGPIPLGRRAAHRAADRRGARSRTRARHRPPRPEAGQHQGAPRRHREGARLRPGEGARSRSRPARPRRRRRTRRRITSPALTTCGMILGTAAYMAPEQAKGRAGRQARGHLGVRRDRAYEMLTGQARCSPARRSPTRWRRSCATRSTGRRCRRRRPIGSGGCCGGASIAT